MGWEEKLKHGPVGYIELTPPRHRPGADSAAPSSENRQGKAAQ